MINLALDIGTTAGPESVLFYFLAPLSVLASIGMLLVKKAVHSALLLAWVMISLAIFLYCSRCTVFRNCSDCGLYRSSNDALPIYFNVSWC
jgi:hypothetical protein